jgi:hypothetical protein
MTTQAADTGGAAATEGAAAPAVEPATPAQPSLADIAKKRSPHAKAAQAAAAAKDEVPKDGAVDVEPDAAAKAEGEGEGEKPKESAAAKDDAKNKTKADVAHEWAKAKKTLKIAEREMRQATTMASEVDAREKSVAEREAKAAQFEKDLLENPAAVFRKHNIPIRKAIEGAINDSKAEASKTPEQLRVERLEAEIAELKAGRASDQEQKTKSAQETEARGEQEAQQQLQGHTEAAFKATLAVNGEAVDTLYPTLHEDWEPADVARAAVQLMTSDWQAQTVADADKILLGYEEVFDTLEARAVRHRDGNKGNTDTYAETRARLLAKGKSSARGDQDRSNAGDAGDGHSPGNGNRPEQLTRRTQSRVSATPDTPRNRDAAIAAVRGKLARTG